MVFLSVVDWESRLPCVLRPRKSRLSLFTRKQQKLLDEAREMDGVPDLSALLKGKLQLLSKKSTPANVPESTSSEGCGASEGGGASKERASSLVDEGFGAEPSASSPRKKKKSKKAKRKATDEAPLKKTASLDEASEGLEARKKKGGRKSLAKGLLPLSIKTRRQQEDEKALQRISSRQTRPRRCLRIVQKKRRRSLLTRSRVLLLLRRLSSMLP